MDRLTKRNADGSVSLDLPVNQGVFFPERSIRKSVLYSFNVQAVMDCCRNRKMFQCDALDGITGRGGELSIYK